MSAPVDVLAVLREATQQVWRAENGVDAKPSVSIGQCDDAIAAVAELIEALRQADSQMLMAADCIENRRYDEALLHVCSLRRQRIAALARCTGEGA